MWYHADLKGGGVFARFYLASDYLYPLLNRLTCTAVTIIQPNGMIFLLTSRIAVNIRIWVLAEGGYDRSRELAHSPSYSPSIIRLGEGIIALSHACYKLSGLPVALPMYQSKIVMPRLLLVVGISFELLESCMVCREKLSQPLFAACVVITNNLPCFCLRSQEKRTLSFFAGGAQLCRTLVYFPELWFPYSMKTQYCKSFAANCRRRRIQYP